MPFVYSVEPGLDFTTSATPGIEIDALFVKPGTRTLAIQAIYPKGKGNGLTAISGIVNRVKKFTSTASSGGSAIAPTPRDPGMQAAKASAGQATGGVTPGTGGPLLLLSVGCGAASPGGWQAITPDSALVLEASATQSMDLFNSSNTASLKFELGVEIVE
jgi:hypothetical protein